MIHRIMCIRTSRGASPIGPRCRVQHVLSSRSYSATSARLTGQVRDRSHVQRGVLADQDAMLGYHGVDPEVDDSIPIGRPFLDDGILLPIHPGLIDRYQVLHDGVRPQQLYRTGIQRVGRFTPVALSQDGIEYYLARRDIFVEVFDDGALELVCVQGAADQPQRLSAYPNADPVVVHVDIGPLAVPPIIPDSVVGAVLDVYRIKGIVGAVCHSHARHVAGHYRDAAEYRFEDDCVAVPAVACADIYTGALTVDDLDVLHGRPRFRRPLQTQEKNP